MPRLSSLAAMPFAMALPAAVLPVAALPAAAQTSLQPSQIAERTGPAVVAIRAFAGGERIGLGSGFLIESDGIVVTNLHVIEAAEELEVHLATGEVYDNVHFISSDERRDLVLLKIPATDLPALSIADSRETKVGESVYVMGHPMGLERTFSDGLVSAKRTDDGMSYLQISAPISHGSSGGPVLNDRGEVIGIATLTIEDGQNLNIAVPARYARGLLSLGEEPRPFADVAGLFASGETPDLGSEGSAGNAGGAAGLEALEGLEGLNSWEVELAATLAAVTVIFENRGYERSHDVQVDGIDEGQIDSFVLEFEPGSYLIVGVCDGDCTDVDLVLLDDEGEQVDSDLLLDATPVLEVEVDDTSEYTVGVSMATCEVEPCFYAVQSYRIE